MQGIDAHELWITFRRTTHDGRSCREYVCSDSDGAELFHARAFNVRREISCNDVNDERRRILLLRRRMSFPLTGRVDILDPVAGRRIGEVRRSGAFRDAAGMTGRFRNARSARSRAAEGAIATVFEVAMGGEGATELSGASGWVLDVNGRRAGSLSIARPPWLATEAPPPGSSLTARFSARLASLRASMRPEQSWRLEREPAVSGDPRVHIAAALFMIELSRW
jgi:hypothetical protein